MMAKGKTKSRLLCLTGAFTVIALFAPAMSGASFEIVPGSVELSTLDSTGNPDTRTGAHPDRLFFRYRVTMSETTMRDLAFEFGPGLTGSASATPMCPRAVFEGEFCPEETQVGIFTTQFGNFEQAEFPIYNIAPPPSQVAAFAFVPLWQTEFGATLRPTDYGLSMAVTDLVQVPSPIGKVELWGVPADHAGGGAERAALLTTPTECGPLKVVVRARSWEVGAPWVSETAESSPFTDCESLPFEPDLDLQLSNPAPDSPTGMQIELEMNQHTGPDERTSVNLKEVKIDLPHGMTVSPGAAEGLDVCRDAQFGLGTDRAVTCPLRSRVGTVELETPQLGETLTGTVFLGEELPGERFRLFVYSSAPGVQFKAMGKLLADEQTGDLSAVLSNLPQFTLDRISMKLDTVPLLVSPLGCGPVSAQARFVPYGPQEPVGKSAVIDVNGSACPNPLPFAPGVVAGSTRVKSGAGTDFSFTLTRRDGEQLMKKFSATFPAGLNANLTTVDPCADSVASSGLCGADSRIGSTVAEVGSGPSTALVRGGVYLTEGYRGAPFGLSIVFDATVGPFHLGSLNVRGALRLDPRTGQVKLETDPLPAVFAGLGLRFRTVGIDLDRPGFLLNPTSCKANQIASSITAVDGRVAGVVNPFNVRGCENLKFRPRVKLALKSRGKPQLAISVRSRNGDANLRGFKLRFPSLLAFHGRGVHAVCARGDALEGLCPAASRVGTGIVRTPLLEDPLRGSVYLVQPKGNGFPDFWSSLEGAGVEMQLTTESFRQKGDLVTELTDAPDVPLSSFTMSLNGGKDGLFTVKGDPCARAGKSTTPVTLQAQNGAHRRLHVQLEANCAANGRKRRIAG